MIANLVAYPKDVSSDLVMREQSDPVIPVVAGTSGDLVLFDPSLAVVELTPQQIADAMWTYVGRTTT